MSSITSVSLRQLQSITPEEASKKETQETDRMVQLFGDRFVKIFGTDLISNIHYAKGHSASKNLAASADRPSEMRGHAVLKGIATTNDKLLKNSCIPFVLVQYQAYTLEKDPETNEIIETIEGVFAEIVLKKYSINGCGYVNDFITRTRVTEKGDRSQSYLTAGVMTGKEMEVLKELISGKKVTAPNHPNVKLELVGETPLESWDVMSDTPSEAFSDTDYDFIGNSDEDYRENQ